MQPLPWKKVVQLKLVAAHVSMAVLQLWGPHPLFGPRNMLQGQSSKCLLNRCWPVLAALPFLMRFWTNIPNASNWIPGSSLNYSNWRRHRVQCGENRSTHWTSFQRTAPWANERYHEPQRHSHTLTYIWPPNSGKRRHVPSNPDVAPHWSSSSSSSSPVSNHVEWGNTINMYNIYINYMYVFCSKGIINPPPPMTDMLNGVITSAHLHKGSTNPPPSTTNILNEVITPPYLHKRSKPSVTNLLNKE